MPLPDLRRSTFSLPALTAEVVRWSRLLRVRPVDERVAAEIDERGLRYYQSLGILDRPLRHDGRHAVYGYRHLLQALATRALQGEGHSLAQVQRALTGAVDAELERAVLDALQGEGGQAGLPGGQSPAALPRGAGAPPAVQDPREWRTIEVAPGLLLTLDAGRFADPQALIEALLSALFLAPNDSPPTQP